VVGDLSDGSQTQTITVFDHGRAREAIVEVRKEYVVAPRNPGKKRNRGRHCIVLAFTPAPESHPRNMVAKVRYLDNNRVGRAEVDDLVPVRESAVG